jgi:hypothetical protein
MLEAEEQMAQLREIANQTLGVARQTRVPKTSDLAALTEAAIASTKRRSPRRRFIW